MLRLMLTMVAAILMSFCPGIPVHAGQETAQTSGLMLARGGDGGNRHGRGHGEHRRGEDHHGRHGAHHHEDGHGDHHHGRHGDHHHGEDEIGHHGRHDTMETGRHGRGEVEIEMEDHGSGGHR